MTERGRDFVPKPMETMVCELVWMLTRLMEATTVKRESLHSFLNFFL